MEEAGEPTIRRDLALGWVSQFSRRTILDRLNHIRQFAEYAAWFDPATEVPVLDAGSYGSHRARPLIFTNEQIDTVLAVARIADPTSPRGVLADTPRASDGDRDADQRGPEPR